MSPGEDLLSLLRRRIEQDGPITFAAFMAEALYHPVHGRYAQARPPMGVDGDYVTSPEIDPAFGRLVGRAVSEMAARIPPRRPGEAFSVVEAGPGRGSLCRDLLLGLDADDPALAVRARAVLVEASAALREAQRTTLAEAGLLERAAWQSWEDLLASGPLTGVILANEFLDALPVHLVEGREGRLREIRVGLAAGGALREEAGDLSDPGIEAYFERLGVRLAEGQRAEVNLAALRWIREAAAVLDRGFVIVVDYGHEAPELFSERHHAGTLLGYHRHRIVDDPLAAPGAHDLTSHVDFTSLAAEARAAGFTGHAGTTQGRLLVATGLAEMIAALAAPGGEGTAERARRRFALHDLINPEGMGEIFKVHVFGKGAEAAELRCLANPFRDPALRPGAVEGRGGEN